MAPLESGYLAAHGLQGNCASVQALHTLVAPVCGVDGAGIVHWDGVGALEAGVAGEIWIRSLR